MPTTTDIRPFQKGILRQPDWLAAFAISGLIVWLHFYFLMHAGGFWRDEVNLINLASRHSLVEMSRDSFPILMPLLISGWVGAGLGRNDAELRLLGIVIGLAIPAALWLTTWKIRRSPPLLGLTLLGLNTTLIMFGDCLRAYGLGSLTILLATAAAARFLQKPTWPQAGIFAALAILSVQALYQNAVFVAAICFGGWAVCARRRNGPAVVKILAVAAVSAASLLPYWKRITALPDAAAALRVGFDPQIAFINFDNTVGFPLEQYLWVWGFLAVAVVACAVVEIWRRTPESVADPMGNSRSYKWTRLSIMLAAVVGFLWFAVNPACRWFFFPLLFLAVAGLDSGFLQKHIFPKSVSSGNTTRNSGEKDFPLFAGVTLLTGATAFAGFLWFAALNTEPWYFIPLLSLAAVCFEIGLPQGRHARAAVFGFAVVTAIIAGRLARPDLSWRLTNLDLVAQRLAAEAAPDDYIIVAPWYCGISFEHYFNGTTQWDTLPPLADHSIHRFDLVRKQMETMDALRPVFEQMATTLQSGHRVWVVARINALPKPGDSQLADLPSPPLKYSGWSDVPYSRNWFAQASQFLGEHSGRFDMDYYTTNTPVNFTESLQLHVAEGWRDSPPTNNLAK